MSHHCWMHQGINTSASKENKWAPKSDRHVDLTYLSNDLIFQQSKCEPAGLNHPSSYVIVYGRREASYTQLWPTSRETLVLQCNLIQVMATSPRIFGQECLCKPTYNHHYNLTQNIAMGGHLILVNSTFTLTHLIQCIIPQHILQIIKWPHLNSSQLLSPPRSRWTTAWLFFSIVYMKSCLLARKRLLD